MSAGWMRSPVPRPRLPQADCRDARASFAGLGLRMSECCEPWGDPAALEGPKYSPGWITSHRGIGANIGQPRREHLLGGGGWTGFSA